MNWTELGLSVGIVNFPTYLLGTIIIVLLPGPNSLYVLTISAQRGWRAGAWGACGIFLGDSVLMLAIALGVTSLLTASPMTFAVVRYVGAAYLAWLGWGLIRGGVRRWPKAQALTPKDTFAAIRLAQLHPLWAALALSLTNPKAIFFFVSFFSQFVDPTFAYPSLSFFYLALVTQILSMAYLAMLIGTGQFFLHLFQTHLRWSAILWMMVGGLFIVFGIHLLIA
ncbi:leucine efflux protein LeuE [Polynucleobacter sp. IMCC30063]|uniref:leucine efflux protein LeuE n=1 Tax=unclassified Polynucleobacter TaxID=2640945 RepID=UPI001F34CE2C|nr:MULTISPECIES: leucine efflux protein LeuE [unclassified Polynucleobacter]MCE7506803.1 leucine efflux protein LeuE [Polynucleobacter sp. IMCC30063]MCE7528120.1 leucine efflux protein LeuE [Polynucleobacter sp. IMCC 30228]